MKQQAESHPYRQPAPAASVAVPASVRVGSPTSRMRVFHAPDGGRIQLKGVTARLSRHRVFMYVMFGATYGVSKLDAKYAVWGLGALALVGCWWGLRDCWSGPWRSPDEELVVTPLGVFWQNRREQKQTWALCDVRGATAEPKRLRVTLLLKRQRPHVLAAGTEPSDAEDMQPLSSTELEWLAAEVRGALERARNP